MQRATLLASASVFLFACPSVALAKDSGAEAATSAATQQPAPMTADERAALLQEIENLKRRVEALETRPAPAPAPTSKLVMFMRPGCSNPQTTECLPGSASDAAAIMRRQNVLLMEGYSWPDRSKASAS